MRITKIIILTILLSSFNSINLTAQTQKTTETVEKEYLKGLTKATENKIATQEIMLDGESIPVYNIEGKRIKGNEIMEAMMSGNYYPDFYMDKNKKIKVIALRITTEDEKNEMKELNAEINDKSELIGKNAFSFYATDMNGNEYSLDKLKGKIIVMNFWFVECKPCVMEMPELNQVAEKYHNNKEIVFLGFATNKTEKINSFLKENNFSYNIIADSKKIANDYKVSIYPTHIIIDKNSKIVYLTRGLTPTTISSIENIIEELIKK